MIDLRSDTVTKPTDKMRDAAATAEVGDDIYGGDPTVSELERSVADTLGMDDALYVPSGTMGNQIASRVHTVRGDEVIVDVESHMYKWEVGGLAQLSQLHVRTVDCGPRGAPSPAKVRATHRDANLQCPGTGLLALENTHNSRGGLAIAPSTIASAAEAASELGIPVHLDGARLFNAAVAQGVEVDEFADHVDSVLVSLSKGLGAPVGSAVAGSTEFVREAERVRQLLGGGMRQAGVIAGPALVALRNRAHLSTDHQNAADLAAGLDKLRGLSTNDPETNIVLLNTTETSLTAATFAERLSQHDVGVTVFGDETVRLVTHKNVSRDDIDATVRAAETVLDAA